MKKILMFILFSSLVFITYGCNNTTGGSSMVTPIYDSVYLLDSKTVDGIDVTKEYFEQFIKLVEPNTIILSSLTISGLEYETGTYEVDGDTINATIGLKYYTFSLSNDANTLTYDGTDQRQAVHSIYQFTDHYEVITTSGDVSFNEELFGENQDLYNFYNYCPSIMMIDGELYIYYCVNDYSGYITDYIGFRKGTMNSDGKWTFTEKELVLGPSIDSWDSRHTCDPTVIQGLFLYQETEYHYLMAYLGCVTDNNANNEVGLAVSVTPEGPWIKVDELNPIANYYTSSEYTNEVWTWGFGQPSLVSIDQAGQVLLFYTRGLDTGTDTYVEYWDFSDLGNPKLLNQASLSTSGVTNISGVADQVNNADFAYDPVRNRLYCVKDMSPKPTTDPTFISVDVPIVYLQLSDDDTYVGETLFSGNYSWTVVDFITPDISGYARNHNPGIITDEYGWLISPNEIPIIYTVSILNSESTGRSSAWQSLHSYRLHGFIQNIFE